MKTNEELQGEVKSLLNQIGEITLPYCNYSDKLIEDKMRSLNRLAHLIHDKITKVDFSK